MFLNCLATSKEFKTKVMVNKNLLLSNFALQWYIRIKDKFQNTIIVNIQTKKIDLKNLQFFTVGTHLWPLSVYQYLIDNLILPI